MKKREEISHNIRVKLSESPHTANIFSTSGVLMTAVNRLSMQAGATALDNFNKKLKDVNSTGGARKLMIHAYNLMRNVTSRPVLGKKSKINRHFKKYCKIKLLKNQARL